MNSCYGLVRTDVDDLRFLLKGTNFQIAYENVTTPAKIMVSLGVRTVSRNIEKLKDSSVLVIDSLIRFRGYTIPILDKDAPVTREKLVTALQKKTEQPTYKAQTPANRVILSKVRKHSIMHLMLQAKYKTTNAELQKKFDKAFIAALHGNKKPMLMLTNPMGKQLLHWLETENGEKLIAALHSRPELSAEEASIKYAVPAFDIRYIESLIEKCKD